MAIDREMPLKEQLKFDMNAADVEVTDGDPQLDADGGATINFGSDVQMAEGHTENLAEFLSDGDLDSIATDLLEAYEGDKDARADWSSTYAEGLGLLGLTSEDRSEPFPGSSGVSHPP